MEVQTFIIILLIVLNIVLIVFSSYLISQLSNALEQSKDFNILSEEVLQVVNHNASIVRTIHSRILEHDQKFNFLLPIIDAHAQVLRIYQPLLSDRLSEPESRTIGE